MNSSIRHAAPQAFPRHSLSRAALQSSGAPIFLLDAFTRITLFYCSSSPHQVLMHHRSRSYNAQALCELCVRTSESLVLPAA